jgi:hypothetical protein
MIKYGPFWIENRFDIVIRALFLLKNTLKSSESIICTFTKRKLGNVDRNMSVFIVKKENNVIMDQAVSFAYYQQFDLTSSID